MQFYYDHHSIWNLTQNENNLKESNYNMKSIKPGRGPSMMSGIMGIGVGLFGVFWTIMAASMGGGFIAIFGIIFVLIAISQVVYSFKNATNKDRYSILDITDDSEEKDPLNIKYGRTNTKNMSGDLLNSVFSDSKPPENFNNINNVIENNFCPFCGNKLLSDFEFCNKCGRKLP